MFRTRSVNSTYAFVLLSVGVGLAQSPVSAPSQPITLNASAVSASAGKSLTFRAKLAAAKSGNTARISGAVETRVTFFDRATIVGTAPVNGQGEASFSTARLTTGKHWVYAVARGGAKSQATEITIEPVASNSFGTAKHFPAGLTPNAMAIADFNGDGHLDIALAGAGGISVLPGHGDGTFGAPVPTTTAFQPTAIAAGDFDGDGVMDLAVTDGTTGKIYFLRGAGDGTFAAPRVVATGTNPVALAIGDFNGDGFADLAVADQAGNTVLLLLGKGDGSFAVPLRIQAGVAPAAIAVGDFNSDRIADLAVANFGGNDVTILMGKGDGTFSSGASLKVGNGPAAILMSDLNGDGMDDLAILNRLDATATVFYGKGDGTFGTGSSIPAGNTPVGIAASDPDKNGFRALLMADGGKIRWQQLTASSARPVVQIDAGATANGIAVGDFTGDGRSGVVIGDQSAVVWHPREVGNAYQIVTSGCPGSVSPGQSSSCSVEAVQIDGVTAATSFTDSVDFQSNDLSAGLPGISTIIPNPKTFNFTLATLGSQIISAQDAINTLDGPSVGASINVVASVGATHFSVSATTPVNAGSATTVTITALDASNATFTDYAGTVQITSSDGQAALSGACLLDSGVGTCHVILKTAGTQTVTVTDTVTSSITGNSNNITVNAGPAFSISVTGGNSQSAIVGAAFATALQVTVKDQYNNPVNGVSVTFQLEGGPAGATFTGSPASTNASGIASVTATANHISGSYNVTASTGLRQIGFSLTNNPGPLTQLGVQAPPTATAGVAFTILVGALDQYENLVTTYSGTLHFSSSDGQAVLPGNSTPSGGFGSFEITLKTAGIESITITDTVTSSLTISGNVTVRAAAPASITATGGTPQTAMVGVAFGAALQVTVVDLYNNPISGKAVIFQAPKTGASATLAKSAHPNSSGIATVPATASHVTGAYTVVAKAEGASATASFSLTNTPGPAASLVVVIGIPEVLAGAPFNVTITALDQYGNVATGYTGTVGFSSTDGQAVLPSGSTLNSGSSIFPVTLKTAGSQTITVTDAGNSLSVTSGPLTVVPGSPSNIQVLRGGTPQSAVVGTAFGTPLQVVVRDFYENPISGATVTYDVPSSGPSAVLSSPTSVTNASGIASITATANLVPGNYTVIPVVSVNIGIGPKVRPRKGEPTATFSLTNLANVTVQASPAAGMAFSVDGVPYITPQSFGFALNSAHTIAVASPQAGPSDLPYGFSNWSDHGAASHSITATGTLVTYTATLGILYPLTTSASPVAGGKVSPASGNLYGSGSTVPLVATPNPGYRFDGWSGKVAEPLSLTTSIVMNGPQSAVATFTLVNGKVSPGYLNLQYSQGANPSTATGSVSVTTADGSAFSVVAADSWLTVSPSSGATPATVTAQANVSGMKPGTYNSTLTFRFSDGSIRLIPVTLRVLSASQLLWAGATSGPLNFTAQSGSTAAQSRDIIVSATNSNVPVQVTASISSPAAGHWLSVSLFGNNTGMTPQALHVRVDPSGLAAGVYQGTITATSTTAGISPLTIPVTLTLTALPPAISVVVIQNAASFSAGSEAPNTILTAFGVYPGCTSGAQVSVDGSPTDVFYNSPAQVNFLLPARVNGEQSASIQIQCGGLKSPVLKVPVLNLAPGIFTATESGLGQAAIVNQDGRSGTPTPAGTYVQVYGTGFGMLKPAGPDGLSWLELPVTAAVGGMPAKVLYSGQAPGSTTGLQQINVQIPMNAPRGAAVPLQLTVGGANTATGVTLKIQ